MGRDDEKYSDVAASGPPTVAVLPTIRHNTERVCTLPAYKPCLPQNEQGFGNEEGTGEGHNVYRVQHCRKACNKPYKNIFTIATVFGVFILLGYISSQLGELSK